jgi:HAMP domain-containing protein
MPRYLLLASTLKLAELVHPHPKGAAVLGRLSITQKLATAVVAPLFVLGGLSLVGVSTFNQVKVNGPEYRKLATTNELLKDVDPSNASLLGQQFVAQSMLQADAEEFAVLKAQAAAIQKSHTGRETYWKTNLSVIGVPELQTQFLGEAGDEYFKIFNEEFVPTLETAYEKGLEPSSFVYPTSWSDAQEIFKSKLTPKFKEHEIATNRVLAIATERRSQLEAQTKNTISSRLIGLALIAFAGAVATFLLSSFIARAIRRPILQLTEAAHRASSEDLPRMVAIAQNATEDTPIPQIEAVRVDSSDEVAELANAFTSMQNTALGLATQQALVRRNVSENLVNLARRNQALLGRTLNLLTQLEQDERDPDKLQDLFRVDHLTTRMRRNAESLLVLAGAEPNRQYSDSVDMGDVVRAAVSAIEAFDRVDIVGLESVQVKGNSVNDVAHLFAELIENATNFSPPDSRVAVIGKAKSDGYLLVITDDGLGMNSDDLQVANARIAQFASFDATPSKVLGLNVVGRLAGRHGIEVSLAESATAGIAARIVIPASLLEGLVAGMDDTVGDGTTATTYGEMDADVSNGLSHSESPIAEWPSDLVSGVEGGSIEAAEADLTAVAPGSSWDMLPSVDDTDTPWSDQFATAPLPEAQPVDALVQTEQTAEHFVGEAPNNVHELRPSSLSRRVRGAQMVDTGPEAIADEPDDSEDRPATVMSTLSNLQQGFKRARSEHPSTQDLDPSASLETSDPEAAVETPVTPTYVSEGHEVAAVERPVIAPPTKRTMLGRRVKGAQLPDTGPIVDRSEGTDANPDEVRSALGNLQRGVASGHAAIEAEGLQDADA